METHTAIFKGVIRKVEWDFFKFRGGHRMVYYQKHEYEMFEHCNGFSKVARENEKKLFWDGQVEKPLFEVGEQVYINELDFLVTITNRYRTTDGEVMYETNHIIKDIDGELESSRLRAVESWFRQEYGDYKTFEDIKSLYEPKKEPEPELEKIQKPEILIGVDNPKAEEKSKEKTWFGWLNFFKKD